VNDPDQTVIFPLATGDELRRVAPVEEPRPSFWTQDGFTAGEEPTAADLTGGLTSLSFIAAAIRRRAWLWCAFAAAGLLIGSAFFLKAPPSYHAGVTILLKGDPTQDPAAETQTDAALAQSTTVAERAVQQLGLTQTVASFQSTYTVTVVSNEVLQINVGAKSSGAAVHRASVLATGFLQARAEYLQAQQEEQVTDLDQQFKEAQKSLNSVNSQISQVSAEPKSDAQQAELSNLEVQRGNAGQIEQYVTGTLASGRTTTDAMVHDSQVINAATLIPHSRVKSAVLYVAGGLFGGLVVGLGIVVVSALVSSRLRCRNDVADAIGAAVRLSVGPVRTRRWWPGMPWRTRRQGLDMTRMITHLRRVVPESTRRPAALAVVAVDNAPAAARIMVTLARSYARQGKSVVLADLSPGAPMARLLGLKGPGVRSVSDTGTSIVVAVPDRDDVAPVGPFRRRAQLTEPALASVQPRKAGAEPVLAGEALTAACASADLLLTLACLDPAFGGDHLGTWASDAVAVVTAGRSSAVRIHAVGEMIRLAGTRLDSVMLIGADKRDESLGATPIQEEFAVVRPV
jgi:capsular polysaccharide biosynthesis protein